MCRRATDDDSPHNKPRHTSIGTSADTGILFLAVGEVRIWKIFESCDEVDIEREGGGGLEKALVLFDYLVFRACIQTVSSAT